MGKFHRIFSILNSITVNTLCSIIFKFHGRFCLKHTCDTAEAGQSFTQQHDCIGHFHQLYQNLAHIIYQCYHITAQKEAAFNL